MVFTELLKQVGREPSRLAISEDWMQGRAAFGGLGAALVYESMRQQLTQPTPVRCLQISFVGPITAEDLLIESEVLREGKSVSQVLGRGIQNGQTKIIIQGSFGASRDSTISIPSEQGGLEAPPESCQKLPYMKGVMPAFTQHLDFRYLTSFPFTGSDQKHMSGFVRFAEPEPEMTIAHLIGLIDAWPPATLPLLKTPAMASSLSWTVEFMHPQPSLAPDEYTVYRAELKESSNGYGHSRAQIWNQKGELLALSQQTVTHFA